MYFLLISALSGLATWIGLRSEVEDDLDYLAGVNYLRNSVKVVRFLSNLSL